jgi:hypothetical protein
MRRLALVLAAAVSLTAAACLQKDTTSTIYLRQDGSFDWLVLERNVRSDESEAAARAREEAAYSEAVARGEHGVATGFRALGADDVHAQPLRSTRPFATMIDGRFDSLSGVFDRLLTRCGIPHEVGISQDADATTWRLTMDVGPDGENLSGDHDEGCDAGLDGLADALNVRIMLESGRFTDATGFRIEGQDTAVFDEEAVRKASEPSGRIELSLRWTAR